MSRVRHSRAFTLIEMLVVISILAALAGILIPAIKNFGRADAVAAASRQMLDDIGRARQLAISQRTTVYMVFLPTTFWDKLPYEPNLAAYQMLKGTDVDQAAKLFDKQLNSYTFFTLRGVGEQPGREVPRYLSPWHSLPEGTFIAPWKFAPPGIDNLRSVIAILTDPPLDPASVVKFPVKNFATNAFPFPFADSTNKLWLPYIAFNYLGQLIPARPSDEPDDEFIPLARGTIAHARDPDTKLPLQQAPTVLENPVSSSTNSFNLLHIDWLTGRAKIERPQIQ